ncbi:hypothetical protein QFC21_005746 [Naganishia friedmannii]|uniref:Uncharacterized protein n=1 Tax=Naganishia friedmannii TaxID=89922 RepID=A0ACC2V718_9TREE|nr:hypothetical protein QFC21_005746 [Naganishia friedmannii]
MHRPRLLAVAAAACCCAWWTGVVVAAAGNPQVAVTRLHNLPSKLFYFEDTTTVLLHDPVKSTVSLSNDEGRSWSPVPNVPEGQAIRLIAHPFSKDLAFILGSADSGGTHWATYNRGASWQSFKLPSGDDDDDDGKGKGRTRAPSLSSAEILSFHAQEPSWILFQQTVCEATSHGGGWWDTGRKCWEETWYTLDAFRTPLKRLLAQTSACTFARSSNAFTAGEKAQVFCVAWDTANTPAGDGGGWHSLAESRLYTSSNWFADGEKKYVDLGIGKRARGVVGFGVVSRYLVVALKSLDNAYTAAAATAGKGTTNDPMHLYISTDGATFQLAQFPHAALPTLTENAYTIVAGTTHSLAIDILTDPAAGPGAGGGTGCCRKKQ